MITKAVVVGAGLMGSGIAAQLANAGIAVTLLDVAADGADRSARARDAIAKQASTGGFMLPSFADRVTPGNVEDDLAALGDAEWIIEAVFEDPRVKAQTFALIDAHRSQGSAVSSNTSTIPLAALIEGQSEQFRRDFTITHFFNPPRIMELLELVAGPDTDPAVVARVREAADLQLGKVVLDCRDTPGFIANRIGNFWMALAAQTAFDEGLDVETADAIMSRPFGIPRTGVFGLFDLVGINLVPLIWPSFIRTLPATDAYHRFNIAENRVFGSLVERGLIGRRGPGGFYRRRNEVGEAVDEVLDESLDYRPRREPNDPALAARGLQALCETDSAGGRFARRVLVELVVYCAAVAPEITDRLSAIDDAMMLGYAWQRGPLALANEVGVDWIADQAAALGLDVPPLLAAAVVAGGFDLARPDQVGVVTVAGLSRGVLLENESARLHDLGDGLACLELRTKMNVCDPGVIAVVEQVTALGNDGGFRALVIGSDNPRAFSAGANLNTFAALLERNDPAELRRFTEAGQHAFAALRRASFPVVAAARGVALGGGCELMLTAARIVAHAELKTGFPERKVGLIPAWGGVTQSLARTGPEQAFALTAGSAISGSAFEAQQWGLLRASDEIVMGSRRVLGRAVDAARALAEGYQPAGEEPLPLHDPAAAPLDEGWAEASETDRAIVGALAGMLTGPEQVSQNEMMRREIEVALDLVVRPLNQDRVRHMIATNKPLAN